MKVMVTGGAGFIGSIVDRLIEEGDEAIIVDDLSTGNERNINPKARFYKLNIKDKGLESVFKVERPDYVCHQAAQKDVRVSVADPIYDAEINILGTINILQNCIKYNTRMIVFASTGGAIYGEQDIFPAKKRD
jgi:UDP-glucose 4-epimerase